MGLADEANAAKNKPKGTVTNLGGLTVISGGDGKTYSPAQFQKTFGYSPTGGAPNIAMGQHPVSSAPAPAPAPSPTISPPQMSGSGGLIGRVPNNTPANTPTPQIKTNFITPPNVGTGGLKNTNSSIQPPSLQGGAGIGPGGRTMEQVAGTPYLSEEERRWYLTNIGATDTLAQAGLQPWTEGGVTGQPQQPVQQVPMPQTTPQGSMLIPSDSNWNHWGEGPGGSSLGFGALGRDPYAGQTQFIPEVEQWRPLVEQYFLPQDVNKVLHVIQGESKGQNILQYDSQGNQVGPASGLMQVEGGETWPGRPSMQELLDPETNLRTAAQLLYG